MNGLPHPHFAYMIVINKEGKQAGRNPALMHVGFSRDPRKRLREHNRQSGVKGVGNRLTGIGAPYWKLRLVIGPFARGARKFVAKWKKKSRTLRRRVAYGISLAEDASVSVFYP